MINILVREGRANVYGEMSPLTQDLNGVRTPWVKGRLKFPSRGKFVFDPCPGCCHPRNYQFVASGTAPDGTKFRVWWSI